MISIPSPPPSAAADRFRTALPEALFEAVSEPERDLVIWRRGLSGILAGYAKKLAATEFSATFSRDGLADALLPDGDGKEELSADLRRLGTAFAHLCAGRSFDGALEAVASDKCRRFHADYHVLRLICTYEGPGTEWVTERGLDRRALAAPDLDWEAAQRAAAIRPQQIQQLDPGDVMLMKGKGWPGAKGAVHRSPAIERAGLRRLVLTLTLR